MRSQLYKISKNKQQKLRALLSSSFIIGGSPCSGKSTIAARLSEELELPYYKVDDHERRHIEKANKQDHPTMVAYGQMSWDKIWSRPVNLQVVEEFAFYRERFDMVLDDLVCYETKEAIIMEGAAFLPSLIHSWNVPTNEAFFLIPTKAFQIEHYSQRPWIKSILESCKNPQQAFENWMERDHLFGQEIIRQAKIYNYQYAIVDQDSDKDVLYAMVKKHFGLV